MTSNATISRLVLLSQLLFLVLHIAIFSDPLAFAQGQCEKELAEAEAKYQLGRLDEPIGLVNCGLEKDLIGPAEREQ